MRSVHFSYLMPPIEQQSRCGQSDGSEHRELIFGGEPPPQIPFKFIHLCTSVSASEMGSSTQKSPSIRRFLSTILYKKWCIYERHCVFFMTHRQYDMAFQMWNQFLCYHRVRSGTRGSEIAAAFSIYLFHLCAMENCRTQKSGMLWDGFSQASKRLLSLLKTEISCAKTDDAMLTQAFSLISFGIDGFAFRSFSCRHHADETLGTVWKNSYQSSATAGWECDGWKWSNTDLCWSLRPQQRWNCTTCWQSAGGRRQQLILYSPLKWNINI